jgi:hypothetical protein
LPHTGPQWTSILFNANRLHARPAGWRDPFRADQYRQSVFKSTVKCRSDDLEGHLTSLR